MSGWRRRLEASRITTSAGRPARVAAAWGVQDGRCGRRGGCVERPHLNGPVAAGGDRASLLEPRRHFHPLPPEEGNATNGGCQLAERVRGTSCAISGTSTLQELDQVPPGAPARQRVQAYRHF